MTSNETPSRHLYPYVWNDHRRLAYVLDKLSHLCPTLTSVHNLSTVTVCVCRPPKRHKPYYRDSGSMQQLMIRSVEQLHWTWTMEDLRSRLVTFQSFDSDQRTLTEKGQGSLVMSRLWSTGLGGTLKRWMGATSFFIRSTPFSAWRSNCIFKATPR